MLTRARRLIAATILPLGSRLARTESVAGPQGPLGWLLRPLLGAARHISWVLLEDPSFLVHLVRTTKPRTYLELGIDRALTFNIISVETPYCVGVDINPTCRAWIGEDTERKRFFAMSTDAYFEKYPQALPNGEKADVIYIDASHEYRQVLRDFEHSRGVVSDSGVIVINDTRPPGKECLNMALSGSVWKVIFDIRIQNPRLEVYTSVTNIFGQSVVMPGRKPCPLPATVAKEFEVTDAFDWEFFERHHRGIIGIREDDFILSKIRQFVSSSSPGWRG